MRPEEAAYIGRLLDEMPPTALARVVELGSSTPTFRRTHQPHIFEHVDTRIGQRGGSLLRVDLKDDPGIDIVGDVFDPSVRARIRLAAPTLVLCCNILEHVVDRHGFCRMLGEVVPPGGSLVASVPRSYPYHLDPIDTLYRPSVAELCQLLGGAGFAPIRGREVESTTYWDDLRRAHGPRGAVSVLARSTVKSAILRGGSERTKARLHRMLWLARPYRVSVCWLRKS